MKQFYYIFCVLIAAMLGEVIAQPFNNSISGILLDKKTKEPLPSVNIYISNTTWGTTSNSNGSFKISSIIPGNHEVVFSMIGYETHSQICKLTDSSKIFIRIEMVPKVYEIKEVTVTAERPEQWFDDLEEFKDEFLGYSPYSYKCKIVNEYDINFTHPEEKILVAESDKLIEVINYTLGYSVKCEIRKFEYNKAQKALWYSYLLFFTELDTNDLDVKDEWERNRKCRYKESLAFFLKTLFEDNLGDEGFEISLVYKPGNTGLYISSSSDLIIKDQLTETCKLNFTEFLEVYNFYIDFEDFRTSWLKLNYPSITIDKYGYPLEYGATTIYGYWAKLGVASFLPKYYGFEESTLSVK
jgi:hypothetical protein